MVTKKNNYTQNQKETAEICRTHIAGNGDLVNVTITEQERDRGKLAGRGLLPDELV